MIWLRCKLRGRPGRPHTKKIKREAKKYKYQGPLSFETISQVEEEIKKASEAYNKFRPKALVPQRKLANDVAMDSGRDPAAVYTEIMHAEQIKEHFKSIRRNERRGERYGVDRVDLETEDGLRTTVKKEEIEEAILDANKRKLLQAGNTPLRKKPLRSIIGENGI